MSTNKIETGVYIIQCKVNSICYVGSTTRSFKRRFREHIYCLRNGQHRSRRMQSHWDRFGEGAFRFIIARRCDPERCLHYEQMFIYACSAHISDGGYCLCRFAGNTSGIKMTKESLQKLSASIKEVHSRQSHKDKMAAIRRSEKFRTKWMAAIKRVFSDPEYARKMSAVLTETYKSEDLRARVANSVREAFKKSEVKDRHRMAMEKVRGMPGYGEKISKALTGSKRTDEQKARIRAAINRPGVQESRARKIRGRKADAEERARRSAAVTAAHRRKRAKIAELAREKTGLVQGLLFAS